MSALTLQGSTSGQVTLSPPAVAGTNTITLPAATGTVALTGSPVFTGTLTVPQITSPAATALTIQSAGTTAMTIDASQNVGIGTSSPTSKLNVAGTFTITGAGQNMDNGQGINSKNASGTNRQLMVMDGSNNLGLGGTVDGGILFYTNLGNLRATLDTSGNLGLGVTPSAWATFKAQQIGLNAANLSLSSAGDYGVVGNNIYYNGGWLSSATGYKPSAYTQISGAHSWYTSSTNGTAGSAVTWTQAMTLDASGNLLVGKTAADLTTAGLAFIPANGGANVPILGIAGAASTNSTYGYIMYSTGAAAYRFYVGYGGTIYATSTSITAISDQSLKTNVKPLETGLAEVMKLQPRRFDWKDQTAHEGTNVAGFIAQEVQEVLPDLVESYKYNDEETKLGLKMGDMIPTLVKALQELSAKVTALEAKVGA